MASMHPRASKMRRALGKNIRSVRKARKLRLIDLARRTGFSIPKLCRIEYGRESTGYADALTIANALGVQLTSLLPRGVALIEVPRIDFGSGVIA